MTLFGRLSRGFNALTSFLLGKPALSAEFNRQGNSPGNMRSLNFEDSIKLINDLMHQPGGIKNVVRELRKLDRDSLNIMFNNVTRGMGSHDNHYTSIISYAVGRQNNNPETVEDVLGHVLAFNGVCSGTVARRFLNNTYYGYYNRSEGEQALLNLPLDIKVNLYESIAADPSEHNLTYLTALQNTIGLSQNFYAYQSSSVREFFEPRNIRNLSHQWTTEGNANSLAFAMDHAINKPAGTMLTAKDRVLAEFMFRKYAEQLGLGAVKLNFYDDPQTDTGGYFNPADGQIYINASHSIFRQRGGILNAINFCFHELQHKKQDEMAQAYRRGEILDHHPDYWAARIYNANYRAYLTSEKVGHKQYMAQVLEADAFYAGNLAKKLASRVFDENGRIAGHQSRANLYPNYA